MSGTNEIDAVVIDLLEQLAESRNVPGEAEPHEIIVSSLDRMRFLVGIEERLDIMLDIGDVLPFDLSSRPALLASVRTLLTEAGVAP